MLLSLTVTSLISQTEVDKHEIKSYHLILKNVLISRVLWVLNLKPTSVYLFSITLTTFTK